MTLGEIKIEALKLMCPELTGEGPEDIPSLRGDTYKRELIDKMPGSVNRCLAELSGRGLLPSISYEVQATDTTGAFIRVSLDTIPRFLSLERVVREGTDGSYDGDCPRRLEGRTLVLSAPKPGERYRILYKGAAERISDITESSAVLGVPEHIAAIIPYYIKGELFREDEPAEAAEARNIFEQALYSFKGEPESSVGAVETVYSVDY